MIGQFSGPYSPVRPAKLKVDSFAKLFSDLSPTVLNVYSKREFKTFFYTLNYVLKSANDLKENSN